MERDTKIIRNSKGQFVKGVIPWIKGRKNPYSFESLAKIKEARKRQGGNVWNRGTNLGSQKGKPRPLDVRIKIGVSQKGHLNHQWKGGITPLRGQIYNTIQWKLWRGAVFERDMFTCTECGCKGGRLEADHIKAFSIIMKEHNIKTVDEAIECSELWDVNNGRTLCRPCHLKTPNYGNRRK